MQSPKSEIVTSRRSVLADESSMLILKIPIPDMPKADLTLLTIRRRAGADGETVGQANGGGAQVGLVWPKRALQ